MTRFALALLALAPAAPAVALSLKPLPPAPAQAVSTPDDRFVLVFHGYAEDGRTAPDAADLLARRLAPGLYRRGEWGAPVWTLPAAAEFQNLRLSPDGAHLAVLSRYLDPIILNNRRLYGWGRISRESYRSQVAVRLFAPRGAPVGTATVADVVRDPEGLRDLGRVWFDSLTFDAAAGVVRLVTGDGNRTALSLATCERVEGTGAGPMPPLPPPPPPPPPDWREMARIGSCTILALATAWVVADLLGKFRPFAASARPAPLPPESLP